MKDIWSETFTRQYSERESLIQTRNEEREHLSKRYESEMSQIASEPNESILRVQVRLNYARALINLSKDYFEKWAVLEERHMAELNVLNEVILRNVV